MENVQKRKSRSRKSMTKAYSHSSGAQGASNNLHETETRIDEEGSRAERVVWMRHRNSHDQFVCSLSSPTSAASTPCRIHRYICCAFASVSQSLTRLLDFHWVHTRGLHGRQGKLLQFDTGNIDSLVSKYHDEGAAERYGLRETVSLPVREQWFCQCALAPH
eukprot:1299903-Rhodomonas_salina.1